MSPSTVPKLPPPGTLLQTWPGSGQLKTTTESSASASMAAQTTPATNRSATFSQSQFALSYHMQISKRDGESSTDYCQQLLKHVKMGLPKPPEELRYIDTREFWKDECNKIYNEKVALEHEVLGLEEERRSFMEKHHFIEAAKEKEHPGPGNSDVRRQGESSQRMEAGTSKKRPAPLQIFLEDQDEISDIDNDICSQMSTMAIRLTRQQTSLIEAIRQASTLDQINHLTKSVLQTISMLDKAIPDCCLPLKSLKANSADLKTLRMLRYLLDCIRRSFHTCFDGMNQLFSTIPGRMKQRVVINRMIMFFQKSLDFLSTISALQSEENEHTQQIQSTRNKRAKLDKVEYAVNRYLAQTLAFIAKQIDWEEGKIGHSEVLEGMLVVAIQRTGRCIKDAVFGEHILAPRSVVIRPETRYIVQVLYATLGGANKKELISLVLSKEQPSRNSSSGSNVPSGSVISGQLLNKVRKQLQEILLESTLGGVDLEIMQLPTIPSDLGDIEDTSDKEEQYGKEWLLERVWGLIGWDMVTPDLA
ncbi:uncharacterized protein RAG0_05184 [Rhynchosporium agropyri]|uniref:Uncharacterized protein n=1 Tax=Rhynchosporium agropyri TaxID=914238 RepID=A0A1E1KC08_9HELO|nr:uncharacterized protein RAG0_05184 [Rhynchosporium agropyri]